MTDNAVLRRDGANPGSAQESLMTVDDNGSPNIPTGETYDINGSPHSHGTGTENHAIVQGRLTLETGVAISTADQTAKTTLYFTPFKGNLIGTYTDAAWQLQSFTEKSLSLAALSADTNYDIFIEDSDLSLSAVAWTDGTNRATALTTQDGVYVKSGDVSKRYLGTIHINSTGGQCEDTVLQRFVWNYYNRTKRELYVKETTDSWNYTTATWRSANNSTANRVQVVVGVNEELVKLTAAILVYTQGSTTNIASTGIALDATNTSHAKIMVSAVGNVALNTAFAIYEGYSGIGYHYLQWTEYANISGSPVGTWYGDNAAPSNNQSGMIGYING